MHVIATAGHVDHGKSTLVRALTGMEPDRFAEERRRGMTIDLGYAWTELDGSLVAFVDVPGHQRFIANMLAGLGPAPAVLFVVAADAGWQEQSTEHLAAVDALGVRHGLLAVTRSDLADPAPALAAARAQLAASSLGEVPAVTVSGATGDGLPALRAALAELVRALPAPSVDERVRLWVDRAFSISGAGTVVTGTLAAGTLRVGDELELDGRPVRVRGLQSAGADADTLTAVARVAVNLRGVPLDAVGRGDALLTPRAWPDTDLLDVRTAAGDELPAAEQLVLHVGTAAVTARVRSLGPGTARLRLASALPLTAGDRAVLREPGTRAVAGVTVLDTDPPPLRRRGAAAARGRDLAGRRDDATRDAAAEVRRRGAVAADELERLGFAPGSVDAGDIRAVAGWLITEATWQQWAAALGDAVDRHAADDPLAPGLGLRPAARTAGVPEAGPRGTVLVAELAIAAGLENRDGVLRRPGRVPSLGAAEPAVSALERRLADRFLDAPERPELAELGLGPRELAVAERAGRLLRLPQDVVLAPDAPDRAVTVLAGLPQPFTTAEARAALGTTRRVAVPLLEMLDHLGRTERLDAGHRRVR